MPMSTLKAIWLWIYNWITILAALVVSTATFILPQIDALSIIDFNSILPPALALKIVAYVAVLKWICVAVTVAHSWWTKSTETEP